MAITYSAAGVESMDLPSHTVTSSALRITTSAPFQTLRQRLTIGMQDAAWACLAAMLMAFIRNAGSAENFPSKICLVLGRQRPLPVNATSPSSLTRPTTGMICVSLAWWAAGLIPTIASAAFVEVLATMHQCLVQTTSEPLALKLEGCGGRLCVLDIMSCWFGTHALRGSLPCTAT